jgi:hypothetical protein
MNKKSIVTLPALKRAIKVMKITVLLLCVCLSQAIASSYAQTTSLSVSAKNENKIFYLAVGIQRLFTGKYIKQSCIEQVIVCVRRTIFDNDIFQFGQFLTDLVVVF